MTESEKTGPEKFIGKFVEKLKGIKKRVLESEVVRIGSAVFFGLIFLLFLLPLFFNNSALKFQISQKFSQILGANLIINGDVEVSFLPVPTITLEDVMLQNYQQHDSKRGGGKIYNIYAKSAQIKLTVFKLFDDPVVKKIILTNVVAESHYDDGTKVERSNKYREIVAGFVKAEVLDEKKVSSGISVKLFSIAGADPSEFSRTTFPEIVINNGAITSYDRTEKKKETTAINLHTKIAKKKISAEGNFNSENIISNFKFLAKFNSKTGKNKSSLEIASPVMEMRLTGDFSGDNIGIFASDFSGKIEAEILELKTFYKSYIGGNDLISGKIKLNAKPIKISADLETKDKEIAVKNFLINSELANGKGDIAINLSDKIPMIDIDMNLENLDFDQIWSNDPVEVFAKEEIDGRVKNFGDDAIEALNPKKEEEKKPEEKAAQDGLTEPEDISKLLVKTPEEEPKAKIENKIAPINFDLASKIKNFDMTAEIKINEIKYLEGIIKDANIYLSVSRDGEIMVLPMVFRVPGDGIFRVNGVFDNSSQLPKFIGKFDAGGKSLEAVFKWMKIESQNLKYDNLKEYSLYSDVMLLPNKVNLSNFYMNLNNGGSELLGEIKIDNTDKTPIITSRFQVSNFNIDDYFLTSGKNIYFSPGSLIRRLLWLNDISSTSEISMSFDKLVYKGEDFPQQSVTLKFRRGYLAIKDLILKSEKTDLKANMSIDISDKNPSFDINILADNFHYETPQTKASSLGVIDGLTSGISDSLMKKNSQTKQNFFDKFLALPSLDGFGGRVMLSFANLQIDDLVMKNVKLAGNLSNGEIAAAEVVSDLYDGHLKYNGMLSIKQSKIINGKLTFTDASIQPLLSDMVNINNVFGIANITASFTSTASDKKEFMSKLIGEVKFSANSPIIKGYGLTDLVRKMLAPQMNAELLREPEKILFNPESVTGFAEASGSIELNGEKEGKIKIKTSAPLVNGILSGTINVGKNDVNTLFNAIFLTGTRQKQTPINIATNLKGSVDNMSQSSNLDQVKQYFGLIKIVPKAPENVENKETKQSDLPPVNNEETFDLNRPRTEAELKMIKETMKQSTFSQ